MSANTALVTTSANTINNAIFGGSAPPPGGSTPVGGSAPAPLPSGADPYAQSTARAVQSIGQTTAIVIQDAGDMLRNISTVGTTAIGVATAGALAMAAADNAEGITNYTTVANLGTAVMTDAAALYLLIGQNAYKVLVQFKS